MKYLNFFSTLLAVFSICNSTSLNADDPIHCIVNVDPAIGDTERIGVNLTYWTTWGADQYMKNILMNPGFEGQINRILVIVNEADSTSFSDGPGLGQADGYWDGASYEVRSGTSVGATGTIDHSLLSGTDGLPQYFTSGPTPALAFNDVVILTKITDPNPVGQWWINSRVTVADSSPAPDSPGPFYIVMQPLDSSNPAEAIFYLDAIGDRAGNLLKVEGPWRLSFWIRGEGPDVTLRTEFQRLNGSPPYFVNFVTPTSEWQQVTYDFTPEDSSDPGTLKLWLLAENPGTTIYLDNVFLGPIQADNPDTAWTEDVIGMLKAMRPSYLRDWQGQLEDTLENRINVDFGRLSWNERLFGGDGSLSFGYSIPDVFELCTQVGSKPWIIIPPTLTDAELDAFGTFLSENADTTKFSDIILEFGNENWNWIFRSGGIPIPEAHGPVADRAFNRILTAAGPDVNIRRFINGQFYNPSLALQFANTAHEYDTIGVAPYYLMQMDDTMTNEEIIAQMFQSNHLIYKQINEGLEPLEKSLAVYEVNMSTLSGTAPVSERNPYLAGAIGGTALAKQLIDGMFNHASPQSVFCLAGFDTSVFSVPGFIKLWGITRDVSTTKRVRPTGLATTLLNEVIAGSLHEIIPTAFMSEENGEAPTITPAAKNLTLAAFRTVHHWGAVVVNANPTEQAVEIEFPNDSRSLPTLASKLTYDSYFDTNEDSELVTITTEPVPSPYDRTVRYTVPPYGLVVFKTAL
jgi:hypothetical protein